MPKYSVPPASLTNLEWLKRIANESAETNRLLRKIITTNGNQSDSAESDDA